MIVLRVANFKHVQNNRDAFVAKSGRSSVLVVDFFSRGTVRISSRLNCVNQF